MLADMDDALRVIQIKDLISDNQWHDRRLPQIADYNSHWSRLVDLPYYAFTKFFSLFMAQDTAYIWASNCVPVIAVTFACAIITAITHRMADLAKIARPHPIALFFLGWLGFIGLLEFSPQRVDHHNFQILCLLGMVLGLIPRTRPQEASPHKHHGGVIISLSILASICIGLEIIPLIIILIGGITIAAAFGRPREIALCRHIGLTLLSLTVPVNLIFVSFSDLMKTSCDAVSAPWVSALMGGGLILFGFSFICKPAHNGLKTAALRLSAGALSGLVLILVTAALFPSCLDGPFNMLSESAKTLWLSEIPQEKSVFWLFKHAAFNSNISFVIFYTAFASILFFVAAPHLKNWPASLKILFMVTIVSSLVTVAQFRHIRLTAILLALFLPLMIGLYQNNKPDIIKHLRSWRAIVFALPTIGLIAGHKLTLKTPLLNSARALLQYDGCTGANFERLSHLPAGVILAPFGISESLLISDHPHQLGNVSFQRAFKGIEDMLTVFFSSSQDSRKSAAQGYDYLVACRSHGDWDLSDSPLYTALNSGVSWPGLTPVMVDENERLMIFKIETNFH